jgi:hypothetical protein
MDKRLYTVTVEVDLQVFAEDEREAVEIGEREAKEEISMGNAFTVANLTTASSLSREWANAIPYGLEEDLTCGQILEQAATS